MSGIRVPLTIVTVVNPVIVFGLKNDKSLGRPFIKDPAVHVDHLVETSARVGATSCERGDTVDFGRQLFRGIIQHHISAILVAEIVTGWDATYINVGYGRDAKRKIEFRPPLADENKRSGLGVLDAETKLGLVNRLGRNVPHLKIAGLWVNPTTDGLRANLNVRERQYDVKGGQPTLEPLRLIEMVDFPVKFGRDEDYEADDPNKLIGPYVVVEVPALPAA